MDINQSQKAMSAKKSWIIPVVSELSSDHTQGGITQVQEDSNTGIMSS